VTKNTRESIANLHSKDDKVRFAALQSVLKETDAKVKWIYDVWEGLVNSLSDENSYQRSIAVMVICNLAKSDTEGKLSKAIGRLLPLTNDEKFVTSRQCIQNLWKVAVTSTSLKKKVVDHLIAQYKNCTNDKHYNLIRLDIHQSLRNICDQSLDSGIRSKALELIEMEEEPKFRKRYAAIWKT
jgi:hypothetical protein